MTIRTNPTHLDRLSALLEGAQPRIEILAHEGTLAAGIPSVLIYLINRGQAAVTLASGRQVLRAPALLIANSPPGRHLRPDDDAEILRLQIVLEGPAGSLLATQFSALGWVDLADEGNNVLARIVSLISEEMSVPRCGRPALLRHAGDILFIALLRQQIAHPENSGELFRALADPKLAKALVAMHENPASPWTLESLAECAAMSRTAFANRFRLALGQPPGTYLTLLRLSLAQSQLKKGRNLKETARSSGYGSASALSRALARARLANRPSKKESPPDSTH